MRLLPRLFRHKQRRFGVDMVWLGLLSIGCAHRPSVAPEIADARNEIARLEGNIATRRGQLPQVAKAPSSADSVPALSPSAVQSAPASRCDGVCVAAQAICGYSRRICALSQQISDEPSQRSCKNAERECSEASNQCASCH